MPPLVYLARLGVKEAMEAKADALILDMKTDGGRPKNMAILPSRCSHWAR